MAQSRILASCLAALACGALVAGCGAASGGNGGGGGGGAGSGSAAATGGGSGGCNPGAAGSGTTLTVAQEPDADVATPAGKCWASIKATPIGIAAIATAPGNDKTTFQVAWGTKALYILAYTQQWPLSNAGGTNWWQSDTTEFTVSGADDHGGSYTGATYQFGVVEDGTLEQGTNASNASPQPTAAVKVVPNKGFYSELTVPWATLQVTPKKGLKLQFDIAEDYSDENGNRVAQYVWAGDQNFYNSTTNWGDITLG